MDQEKPREECGIFGIFDHLEASRITYLGLYALQHRGQESCGIVCFNDAVPAKMIGMGKVVDFFTEERLDKLKGNSAIGHVRYSTTGASRLVNAQPILVGCNKGQVGTAHNGNIVNAVLLREALEEQGHIFQSTNDSEVLSHLIACSRKKGFYEAVEESVARLEGAFSLLVLREDAMVAFRDPNGFRPLTLGRLGGSWIVASETSALDVVGAEHVRDIEAGEMLIITHNGLESRWPFGEDTKVSRCVFELIYFARPNSFVFGESVYAFRKLLGKTLAAEVHVDADVVIPVPDSGTISALGFAEEAGIPFGMGLIRSHYIGRTFIEPTQKIRDFGVRIKFAPVKGILEGKRVVLVDDSLVRGTTSRKIVKMVREAGAKEVHLRISAPPSRFPCYYGIDFPDPAELVANKMSVGEIARSLGVESLGYVSIEGMYSAMSGLETAGCYCAACFDGEYPVVPTDYEECKGRSTQSDLCEMGPGERLSDAVQPDQ